MPISINNHLTGSADYQRACLELSVADRAAWLTDTSGPIEEGVLRWPLTALGSRARAVQVISTVEGTGLLDRIAAGYDRDYAANGQFVWLPDEDAAAAEDRLSALVGEMTHAWIA